MEYKFTPQKNRKDCGLAGCCMLINYFHDQNLTLAELKYENAISDSELSFYNIENILQKYGIEFKSYYASFQDFCDLKNPQPMIVNLQIGLDEHFIVVYKFSGTKLLIADPADKDIKWVLLTEIQKYFSGYFGIASKKEIINFKKASFMSWAHILVEEKSTIFLFVSVSLIMSAIIFLANTFLKNYSRDLEVVNQKNKLIFYGIYISLFISQIFLTYVLNRLLYLIRIKINKKMCQRYFEHILKVSSEKFCRLNKDEWLKIIAHLGNIAELLTQIFILLPCQAIIFIAALVMVSLMSPTLLILMVLEMVLVAACSLFFNGLLRGHVMQNYQDSLEFSLLFREILDGHKEIKTKNLTDVFSQKLSYNFEKNIVNENSTQDVKSLNSLSISLISKGVYVGIFFVTQSLILKDSMNFSQLLFYLSISIYVNIFFEGVINIILNKESSKLSLNEAKIILENKSVQEQVFTLPSISEIICEDVYKYHNEELALRDLSFKFDQNTFITGPSGVGKTTLLQIFAGLVSNFEGNILINGIDLNNVSPQELQNKIHYLGQYDYLFNASVWVNLQQFKNEINLDEFKNFGFFELFKKYQLELDKVIVDNGANLSKGQRQIINFVALFFTNKEVYLIDEPLSNVDNQTAYHLVQKFLTCKKDKLIIMTDHNQHYKKFFTNFLEMRYGK